MREALENLLEETDDEEAIELIEDAIDNLMFNEDLQDFNFMDFPLDDDLTTPDNDLPIKE